MGDSQRRHVAALSLRYPLPKAPSSVAVFRFSMHRKAKAFPRKDKGFLSGGVILESDFRHHLLMYPKNKDSERIGAYAKTRSASVLARSANMFADSEKVHFLAF
uniref:Uncharacterized protein n=1 Tax=Candidatus Kentrum sp. LFY TaxID=2126342 RepID=A0A450UV48_9GAMM|nr:MAG: hypothetical protein BECKLFY1418A_GA0070994_105818 [Candidatus Kentron sp. LFY]